MSDTDAKPDGAEGGHAPAAPTDNGENAGGHADAALVVLTTVPDRQCAQRIAHALVAERLAACVTVLPEVVSIYRWQGAIEQSQEIQLLIKTRRTRYAALQHRLEQLHPYDVPEVLAMPVHQGLARYVAWVLEESSEPR